MCQSAENILAKEGTEHHEPKPATRDADGGVKAPPRSSNLSSALQQRELHDQGTLMASLQLLPRMCVGDPMIYTGSRTASSLERNEQNELDCAVDMHQPHGKSFRKGTHS